MSRLHKLTATGAKALTKTGRHSDGGGLYLRVQSGGRKSWLFMWKRESVQREVGLGSFVTVTLKAARQMAQTAREALARGEDPKIALRPPTTKTFLDAAEACLKARDLDSLNPKTKRKWERTAFEIAKPLHRRPVADVKREDILKILTPIWQKTPETGRNVRSHLEIIFNYAKGREWSDAENPALWKGGLEAVLPALNRANVKHHPAMPYGDVPDFIERLRERPAIAARALEFTILTAVRTSEALDAVISEFDLDAGTWTIPAERMKSGRHHTVPLSDRAIEIVQDMRAAPVSDYVFFGQRPNRPLSNMSMLMLMRRMKAKNAVPHGFRSTFRDWAGDRTRYAREVAEAALSHSVGDVVERSYRRGDALEKRRGLMQDWAAFCEGELNAKVVQLRG
ncbi:tyrosine-type recombinase/integrase [Litorimonas sp. WD9-15]|uniref:tyrosine-type recombinase/integrase n=1 Tax=Litorimonas sp. WD9-15 TaxID=3418716 RepID=UPI003CFFD6F7